ncbi:kinesin-like protein KIN-14L [Arachis stenosperma]|uniref:kinesin-like protein KIN-14L n=1 Tax=Arachis stenosperma TaxID=217475 RepID=UPI0025AD769A|nr:kinesin-like protein KIN-14L [Arachis stenosperma]
MGVPLGRHYLFLTTFLFVKPILIRSLLSHISLLCFSGIPANIESDRKRKKSPVVPAEQKEKHKPHLNKTKKMSYCGNSHGGDGGELILIRSPLSDTSLLTLSEIPAKIDSDRKRKKCPVVPMEQKEKHKQHLNNTNKMSYCSSSDGLDGGSQVEDIATKDSGYNRVVEENGKLFNMVQDLKGNIRVYCKIRPTFQAKSKNIIDFIGEDGSVFSLDPSKTLKDGRKLFHFSRDIDPLIRSVMDGYNVCIFAYGETRSRKTYTMCPSGGTFKDMWINYLPLNYLFRMCNDRKNIMTYDIYVQMVEIYNEQFRNLLAKDETDNKLEIRSCNDDQLSLLDATFRPVTSTSDVLTLMKLGEVNCAVSSTALNNRSSCSHG